MASFVISMWQQLQKGIEHGDPRSKDWVLLWSSPVYVWALTSIYLIIVFCGPHVMKNRQPFSLQYFLIIYNLGCVGLSTYMFVEILLSTYDAGYNFLCAEYNADTVANPKEMRVANVLWWYFFSKAIELMDTVLMVLRKKNNQITFLHWFHHATMLNIWWWVMMWIPGGQGFFGSCLNCLVHIVMYAYYGLSAIPSMKNKLWWKRYITRFQLIQFCITLTHTLGTKVFGCDFPPWGVNLLAGYMIFMLILFSNFYIRTYMMKKKQHQNKKMQKSQFGAEHVNGVNGINGYIGNKKKK